MCFSFQHVTTQTAFISERYHIGIADTDPLLLSHHYQMITHVTPLCLCVNFAPTQITRNHYQNAMTATRMDSSPQTPDAVDPDVKGRHPVPEARSHSIALPLTNTHTRMGLARLAHLHPHGGLCNTSQLNARNRIVRKSTLLDRFEGGKVWCVTYELIIDGADIKADHVLDLCILLIHLKILISPPMPDFSID